MEKLTALPQSRKPLPSGEGRGKPPASSRTHQGPRLSPLGFELSPLGFELRPFDRASPRLRNDDFFPTSLHGPASVILIVAPGYRTLRIPESENAFRRFVMMHE